MRIVIGWAGLILLISASGYAETKYKPSRLFIHVDGKYLYTRSAADEVAGATYGDRFANPLAAGAGIGYAIEDNFYVGINYEHWLGRRVMSVSGVTQTDTLQFQAVDFELGYKGGSSRVFWLLTLGINLPLRAAVSSTLGEFTSAGVPFNYGGRGSIGIRLGDFYSLLIEGGYRVRNLGRLASGATAYLPNNAELNLSGFFLGLGVWFHF